MACTMAALAPVATRPVAALPLKQAKNTFAARTVSNGSIQKTSAMQGEQCGSQGPASARPTPIKPAELSQPADPPACCLLPSCLQCGPL
jgi:hypothetical protein